MPKNLTNIFSEMSDFLQSHRKVITILLIGFAILWASLCVSHLMFLHFLGYAWRDLNWQEANLWDFLRALPAVLDDSENYHHWLFSLIAPLGLILFAGAMILSKPQRNLFGNAHWSSFFEAKKAGILNNDGLILGKKWGKYLRVSGFEHVFVFAPSGSGKTASMVMPNLLSWNDSCIVQDVKGSIFKETSQFRTKYGHACYFWNPGTRDSQTHAYNPLDSVSKNSLLRIDDLQKIANILIPDPVGGEGQFFASTSRQLFLGLTLYLLDTPSLPKTLGEMNRLAKNSSNFPKWVTDILKERSDLDPVCYRNLLSFVNMEPRTQANIYQSFLSYFELFDNPLLDAATSHSDFDIMQLRKKRMTIYVAAGSDNLSRLSPLLTVFYQQVMDALLRELPNSKDDPYGVLMMLDEFSALKRMEVLRTSIGLMREYRIRVMAIIQDLPQLYVTYGHDGAKAFINSKYRVAFAQNDLDAARLVSGWLGDRTVEQRSRQVRNGMSQSESSSVSLTKVPLKSSDEILKLSEKNMIVVIEGKSPVLCKKVFWYKDPEFKNRAIGSMELPFLAPFISPFDHAAMVNELKEKIKKEKKFLNKKPIELKKEVNI